MTRRSRSVQTHRDDRAGVKRPSRYEFSKVAVDFESGGERCSGWLYRPDRPAEPPVIVMAPGLGAEMDFGPHRYAERLAAEGYAVLLFDYRGFGSSDGGVRRLISPARQVEDYRAAVAAARGLDGVDASRVALWGASLAGGHVLQVAAGDPRIAAVVAQAPVVDGVAFARRGGVTHLVKGVVAGVRDRIQSLALGPHTVPVVGDADEFAVVSGPGARYDFEALVPPQVQWENATPARVFLSLLRYRPAKAAERVTCPTLVVAGARDAVAPADAALSAAESMPNATYLRLPIGHFDAYGGRAFERSVDHQLAFLENAL